MRFEISDMDAWMFTSHRKIQSIEEPMHYRARIATRCAAVSLMATLTACSDLPTTPASLTGSPISESARLFQMGLL